LTSTINTHTQTHVYVHATALALILHLFWSMILGKRVVLRETEGSKTRYRDNGLLKMTLLPLNDDFNLWL